MSRATYINDFLTTAKVPSKSIQVFLPVTLFLILSAVVTTAIDPGVGGWVAFTLSMLLLIWMYLGKVLASTTLRLRSIVKNLQLKNHELLSKIKVAEETCEVKSQFLASMSHEIRTPLSAILGFVELLDDPNISTEEHLEFLSIVRSNSEYLIKVVNDILDISHLNSGKLKIEPKPTKITEVLNSVVSMLQLKAEKKNLALSIEYWSPMPSVIVIDEARLRQIVVNLISNAIKFTEKGAVDVRIGCHSTDDRSLVNFELVVRDSGIGIHPEERNKLFNMFSQVNTEYIARSQGHGLGLAISKSLANMMGGDLTLLDSSPGKGSSFMFHCPTLVVDSSESAHNGVSLPYRNIGSVFQSPIH